MNNKKYGNGVLHCSNSDKYEEKWKNDELIDMRVIRHSNAKKNIKSTNRCLIF